MKNSARKMFSGRIIALLPLLLLLICAHQVVPQQPASKTSPTSQSPVAPADVRARVNETAIDSATPNDPAVDKMLAPYSPKVRELEVVIGRLKGELSKGGTGAGSLGNFVTDGMRWQA